VCHPLIIQRECGFFDGYILSTDSEAVAAAAAKSGFPENYRRPEDLSMTRSSVWSAVRHGMKYLSKMGNEYDYIAIMHPTSPCIRPQTVIELCEHFHEHRDVFDAMVAVTYSSPFSWCAAERPDFSKAKNTQDHVPRFELTNAFFIAKWDKLMETKNLYSLNWAQFTIEADEAIDIDEETDLHMAEAILQWREKNEAKEPTAGDLRTNKYAHVKQIREALSRNGRCGADKPL
jgi:N-acylneuraminate cytidylyltransferase